MNSSQPVPPPKAAHQPDTGSAATGATSTTPASTGTGPSGSKAFPAATSPSPPLPETSCSSPTETGRGRSPLRDPISAFPGEELLFGPEGRGAADSVVPMTGPAASGAEQAPSPYDEFLTGLGQKPTADEYEQWARDHDTDPDVPRALIQAGWHRSESGAHEQALALFQQAQQRSGEQTRNAQVGIVEQLYALGRTEEGDTARDVLRAELDAATPPDLWIYNEMVELLSEWAEPEMAMAWCEAALFRADTEDCGEHAEHHQSLLLNRSLVREQLGVEPDELDRAVEAEEDRGLQELFGPLRDYLHGTLDNGVLSDDGPVDGVILRWARADFPTVRQRWPESTDEYGNDYETYAAGLQRTAHRFSADGAVRVRLVTGTLADYEAYARRTGENPDDPATRIRYATWRDSEFEQETLFWPPPRNAPCWCESGRKYKKCCGAPSRN